jgi:hypothetical protein
MMFAYCTAEAVSMLPMTRKFVPDEVPTSKLSSSGGQSITPGPMPGDIEISS